VANPVVVDVAPNPADVRLLGAVAHVADAECRAHAIQELRGTRGSGVVQGRAPAGPGPAEG
jgi:hypothetical protein